MKDNVAEMDKQYDALPKCFQERIDKFRENNERFRIDFESYELFCCEQAVEIAKGCKSAAGVEEFRKLKWEEQLKQVPELSDGHSGNTFGCAVHLAYWYLQQPDNMKSEDYQGILNQYTIIDSNDKPYVTLKGVELVLKMHETEVKKLHKPIVSGWVAVTEPPPFGGYKLCIKKGYLPYVALYDFDDKEFRLDGEKITPTHWQELPEQPCC